MSKLPFRVLSIAAAIALLAACGSDNDDLQPAEPDVVAPPPAPVVFSYEVTVTNLTSAQPLSPIAVLLHNEGDIWQIGEQATLALEEMAEGGDTSSLRALSFVEGEASGSAPIGPGGSDTLTVSINDSPEATLSVATMLVNTNDAFSGLNAYSLANLAVGDTTTVVRAAYDAGTEANTEASGTMPGPADGGEGFNAMRNDVDFVARHQGVVTADDGLSSSVLDASHKFDNPVIRISITRIE